MLRKDLTLPMYSFFSSSSGLLSVNEGVMWYEEFSLYNGRSMKNAVSEGSLPFWVKLNVNAELVLLN